jgi:hypothetical protein
MTGRHIAIHAHLGVQASGLGTVNVRTRQYVTMEHLWTARHAARLCKEREAQISNQATADTEHRSLAVTTIFFAAAFVEALVNEVILDVIDPGGPSSRTAGIPPSTVSAFRQLWRREHRLGIRGKYQEALQAVGKRPYDERRDPAKSLQLVIELRNHFVHYKPEWQDIDAEHYFERALKKAKVVENPATDWRPVVPEQSARRGTRRMGLSRR